ncbi:hypothetical protein [Pyrobaculum sp.]|uniref:hypothetical protein n=1 Tax=Pyrobaculum sp. TaxID=2004705 RepID=UPI00317153EC
MGDLLAGLIGSLAAAVVILVVLYMVAHFGVLYLPAMALMTLLVVIAVYVYIRFKRALGERWFTILGPPVIGASAAGVVLLWLGRGEGAVVVAAAYFGEPVLGYFIYKKLAGVDRLWAAVFLLSAAAYAYSLPAVMAGHWYIPFAADLAKTVALVFIIRRVWGAAGGQRRGGRF